MTDLTDRLTEFVRALRAQAVSAGPSETADAAAAIHVLGLADREQLRAGVAAALLRREDQRRVFDQTFDVYFPLGVGTSVRSAHTDRDTIREELTDALIAGDASAMDALAIQAVDTLGVVESGPGGYSAMQALDRLQPQTLLASVLAALSGGADFTERLTRQEIRGRIEQFRENVRTQARRRVAELRGRERVVQHAIAPPVTQTDFLSVHSSELAQLRRTVAPLARKLATRLAARRKNATRGQIALRPTLRRSLATGGVPLRPVYRHRRPSRPELVLFCDVSGSVAGFAQFTMLLVQALHDQFSKLRVFAFVDATAEVTELVRVCEADPARLSERIFTEAQVATWHGHSDYVRALGQLLDDHGDALTAKATVVMLGDARNNGGPARADLVAEIAGRVRRVHWLNPERRTQWSQGDSVAESYAQVVQMHECRNVEQLTSLVSRILPV